MVEAFFTKLKVSFIASIFLSSPAIPIPDLAVVARRCSTPRALARRSVFFGTFFFVAGGGFCSPWCSRGLSLSSSPNNMRPSGSIRRFASANISPLTSRMLLDSPRLRIAGRQFILARLGVVTHRLMLGYARTPSW